MSLSEGGGLITDLLPVIERETIPYALIGAMAMMAHGLGRSTFDIDLLTTDARALKVNWPAELPAEIRSEVRPGEYDDPLAGIVTFDRQGAMSVDLVIGRWKWQLGVLERSERMQIFHTLMPVASLADLVLLKLDAGGPQDMSDARRILQYGGRGVALRLEELALTLPPRLTAACNALLAELQ